MKKTAMAVAALIACGGALAAEKVFCGGIVDDGYFECRIDTIRKTSSTTKMWVEYNLLKITPVRYNSAGKVYRSDISRVEFDCALERMRTVSIVEYADYNLAGSVVWSEQNGNSVWQDVVPFTNGDLMLKTACKKK